jgi:RNA polymerase sigma-70 factor (ECF subfamily)
VASPLRADPAAASQELLERFRRGDRAAFLEIYAAHAEWVRPVATRFFPAPFDREEAVQEIWLQVFRSRGHFDPARGELWPWLKAVAINRCRELLRARGRRPAAELGLDTDLLAAPNQDRPDELAWHGRVTTALGAFLGGLDQQEAAVFRLSVLEEQSRDEVARALGISPRRCKYLRSKLLRRALEDPALRALLEEVCRP